MSIERHDFSLLKLTIVALLIVLHVTLANAAVGDVLISDASKTLSVGESWNLEEGYTLTLIEIDIDSTKVFVELCKNNEIVESSIVSLSDEYSYRHDIGEQDDVVIILVTLSTIPTANTATFSSLHQYSDGTTQTTGSIAIWSDQLDSNIYLDETYSGQTGSDWVWLNDVSVGTHTVKITKSGYDDWTDTVSVTSDEYATVYAYLEQNTGSIAVWSDQLDSNIYLDGMYSGQTRSDWVWLNDVSAGTHTVKITKSGYDDWTDTVFVTSGVYSTVYTYLEQNTGSIKVSSSPSGANVYLDGTYKGTVPLTLNSVSTGSHTVKLTKSGYDDWTETVFVISGVYSTVDAYLELNTGSIGVWSDQLDSNIYLDGTYFGQTESDWVWLNDVSVGTHTIKITKSGYDDWTDTVSVTSDEYATVYAYLEQNTVSVTSDGYATVYAMPEESSAEPNYYLNFFHLDFFLIFLFIWVLLVSPIIIIALIIRSIRKKKASKSRKKPVVPKEVVVFESNTGSKSSVAINKLITSSAFGYKGATIVHKIKIENPTSEPIGDIKIHLFVPDVFLLENKEKSISMLEPGEGKTVTFEIRPTGECGDCNVSGRVNYYDYGTKKRQEIDLETKSLSVVCPLLKIKDIPITEWRNMTSHLVRTEETTRDISIPAETLFSMASRVIEDMNMFMLEPEIVSTPQMYNGVAKFYGVGVKDLNYAAQIEVVGGAKKSKLILKAWAEREDALTGFYHGILDELEKRVQVKGYINDSIVQNFYHYGDNIGTQVKDSFVYKSNVGSSEREACSQCGKERVEGERFCSGCGARFE